MNPLLVGETNPYGADPHFALYPEPRGCAGWRLCVPILGLAPDVYLARFDRANLLATGSWSEPAARRAASALAATGDERRMFVLLGAKVTAAFQPHFATTLIPFQRYFLGRSPVVVLPHPSGRCRVWGQKPDAVARARALVLEGCS